MARGRGHRSSGSSSSNSNSDVAVSKRISYVLRHGAVEMRVPIRPDGYVLVDALCKVVPGLELATLQRLVQINEKQRFDLRQEDDQQWWIRANQGHSIPTVEVDMEELHSADDIVACVHGTYHEAMASILANGLKPMTRQHVHMAAGLKGEVKSGYRADCQVLIHIDLARMLADGKRVLRSKNGVLLTTSVEPRYFARFTDVTGAALPQYAVPAPPPAAAAAAPPA